MNFDSFWRATKNAQIVRGSQRRVFSNPVTYSLHCNHNNKLQVCIYSTFHTIDLSVHAFSRFFCLCQLQRFGQVDAKGQNDPNFGWCHPFNLHCQQTSLDVDKTLSEVHKLPLKIQKGESNFNSPCQERLCDVTRGCCMCYIIIMHAHNNTITRPVRQAVCAKEIMLCQLWSLLLQLASINLKFQISLISCLLACCQVFFRLHVTWT